MADQYPIDPNPAPRLDTTQAPRLIFSIAGREYEVEPLAAATLDPTQLMELAQAATLLWAQAHQALQDKPHATLYELELKQKSVPRRGAEAPAGIATQYQAVAWHTTAPDRLEIGQPFKPDENGQRAAALLYGAAAGGAGAAAQGARGGDAAALNGRQNKATQTDSRVSVFMRQVQDAAKRGKDAFVRGAARGGQAVAGGFRRAGATVSDGWNISTNWLRDVFGNRSGQTAPKTASGNPMQDAATPTEGRDPKTPSIDPTSTGSPGSSSVSSSRRQSSASSNSSENSQQASVRGFIVERVSSNGSEKLSSRRPSRASSVQSLPKDVAFDATVTALGPPTSTPVKAEQVAEKQPPSATQVCQERLKAFTEALEQAKTRTADPWPDAVNIPLRNLAEAEKFLASQTRKGILAELQSAIEGLDPDLRKQIDWPKNCSVDFARALAAGVKVGDSTEKGFPFIDLQKGFFASGPQANQLVPTVEAFNHAAAKFVFKGGSPKGAMQQPLNDLATAVNRVLAEGTNLPRLSKYLNDPLWQQVAAATERAQLLEGRTLTLPPNCPAVLSCALAPSLFHVGAPEGRPIVNLDKLTEILPKFKALGRRTKALDAVDEATLQFALAVNQYALKGDAAAKSAVSSAFAQLQQRHSEWKNAEQVEHENRAHKDLGTPPTRTNILTVAQEIHNKIKGK